MGSLDCHRNSKWLLIQPLCAFKEHQSSPWVSRTGAAASKMAARGTVAQRQQCSSSCSSLLILLWSLCSQGSLSYPSHLRLKISFFSFFLITSHMFLCDWNLNPGRMWTPHTQSQKPWSCQCLRDEGWITNLRMCHTKRAREEKVFMFPFVSPVPPPISGQLCLFLLFPDFGNHLPRVLLSQLLRMI